MRVVTIKIDPSELELVDMYAARHNISRSEVIRMAISEFLARHRNEWDTQVKIKIEKMRL